MKGWTIEELYGAGNTTFLDYFENDFKRNTIGTFKAPASVVADFNGFATEDDRGAAASAIGQVYLDALCSLKYTLVKNTPFNMVEEDTRDTTKEFVASAVLHAVQNHAVYERVVASTISTPSFSMNTDTAGWILTVQMLGMFAKNLMKMTGLDEYEWIEEDELYADFGINVKVVGRSDLLNETFWKVA